jgi:NADPH:quinone reductase-like Zn-dependent oxidoreductase
MLGRALFTKAQVSKGQNVLLTGVGGGVAMLALQMAVAAGANVYVTGGSADKIARAVKLGAKAGTEYKDTNWPGKIRKLLPRARPYLDCVVDSAGGEIAAQAQKAGLKAGGRVVIFGMTAAPKLTYTMKEVLKNIEVLGSTMGSAKEFEQSIRFVEQHRIVPVVDTVLDGLEQADQGFELLAQADKRSGGKVVIRLASEQPKSKL